MTTTTATVPPPLSPALSTKEGRAHLRATLLLLHILEGRAVSLTLGYLLSLEDDASSRNGRGPRRDNRDLPTPPPLPHPHAPPPFH